MKKIFFKNKFNEKICGVIDEPSPEKKIIILIHGFSSNKDKGTKIIAEELGKNKINTLRIDLDNLGESEPKFEFATITKYIGVVESAIKFCKDKGYKKISLLGTSTGGLVAMATTLKHPELKFLILRSPTSSNDEDVLLMKGKKGLKKWKEQGYTYHIKSDGTKHKIRYEFVEDGHQYTMYDKVKNIKIPTLIIQGTDDECVNPENTKKLTKNFPDAKLELIKGADHSLGINENYEKSLKILINWLKKK
ncbi:MAG: alpha/beta fold hydrolase [Candidatus Pacearchaeota archaeon]|nr:MAG: alpha/beta fold hydrolase [Candidatus Pacearchaeota archaeon]